MVRGQDTSGVHRKMNEYHYYDCFIELLAGLEDQLDISCWSNGTSSNT